MIIIITATSHYPRPVYVKCTEEDIVARLTPFTGLIKNLGSGNDVKVISSTSGATAVPAGCIVSSVNGSVEVHLMLKVALLQS